MLGTLVVLGAAALLMVGGDFAEAGNPSVGSVTYVKGKAQRGTGKTWKSVSKSSKIYKGDRLKTEKDSRLEATLNDGSVLRLGANSELSLEKASVKKKQKKVKARLWVGRVWASVTKLFGSDSEFEVTTSNAVAGVRGTRFSADQAADGTTTVKVYSGQVLISNKPIYAIKGHTKSKRVEVQGPVEISKKEWEEMVASAMQMVQVAASGEMTKPEAFAAATGGDDDWEAWNAERDKVAGIQE